jgi:cytochrome b561
MQWRNTVKTWGLLAIGLHWVTVIIIIGQFSLGLWMVELNYYDSWYKQAPSIHKSIGILLFALIVFRLAWRWQNIKPDELPSHTRFERQAAQVIHTMLYVLMFAIMLSGYLISTADARSIEVFGLFEVPAIIYGLNRQEDIAGAVHLVLAVSLLILVMLHALAALKHHFVDKDRTLLRMLGK